MGQPALVSLQGVLSLSPAAGCGLTAQEVRQLAVCAAYSGAFTFRGSVNAPIGSPYAVPLQGLTAVRFLWFRAQWAPMLLLLTSVNGGAVQKMPVSDQIFVHNPNGGDEFTAIGIVGNGDYELVLAGDTT